MNIFHSLLIYIVWFASTYFVVLFLLLLGKYSKGMFEDKPPITKYPSVTVIVPAFNESNTIQKTLRSLEQVEYDRKKLEIIVVNDGSTDLTSRKVVSYKSKLNIVFIDNKKNKGKAACLNQAIKIAKGEFIVCMDADTIVKREILKKSLAEFVEDSIAAVTVSIDLRPKNLLQKITEIEYAIGLSLSIGILSKLDSVHVTPGPFTIFRKKVLDELRGFDINNITEDLEIAYRLHKKKYKIKCCLTTKVFTEVPRTLKSLYKQRRRWYTGALQTVTQHRDILFNRDLGIFGIFVPYNFTVIILGVIVFLLSIGLTLRNFIKDFLLYRFTNFNFFQYFKDLQIDLLSLFTIYWILAFVAFMLAAYLAYSGLRIMRKSTEPFSYLVFLYLFLLYQIFWISSAFAYITKRRLTWR